MDGREARGDAATGLPSIRGRLRGPAPDDLRRQQQTAWTVVGAADLLEDLVRRLLAEQARRLAHRRQLRVAPQRPGAVVEADHADVAVARCRPLRCRTSIAPAATASDAANTPSMSGARSSSSRMPSAPAV